MLRELLNYKDIFNLTDKRDGLKAVKDELNNMKNLNVLKYFFKIDIRRNLFLFVV